MSAHEVFVGLLSGLKRPASVFDVVWITVLYSVICNVLLRPRRPR